MDTRGSTSPCLHFSLIPASLEFGAFSEKPPHLSAIHPPVKTLFDILFFLPFTGSFKYLVWLSAHSVMIFIGDTTVKEVAWSNDRERLESSSIRGT